MVLLFSPSPFFELLLFWSLFLISSPLFKLLLRWFFFLFPLLELELNYCLPWVLLFSSFLSSLWTIVTMVLLFFSFPWVRVVIPLVFSSFSSIRAQVIATLVLFTFFSSSSRLDSYCPGLFYYPFIEFKLLLPCFFSLSSSSSYCYHCPYFFAQTQVTIAPVHFTLFELKLLLPWSFFISSPWGRARMFAYPSTFFFFFLELKLLLALVLFSLSPQVQVQVIV